MKGDGNLGGRRALYFGIGTAGPGGPELGMACRVTMTTGYWPWFSPSHPYPGVLPLPGQMALLILISRLLRQSVQSTPKRI